VKVRRRSINSTVDVGDDAVTVAGHTAGKPGGNTGAVAGDAVVFGTEGADRDVEAVKLADLCTDLGRADKVLSYEHTADDEADDNQHNRQFDQRETSLPLGPFKFYPSALYHN